MPVQDSQNHIADSFAGQQFLGIQIAEVQHPRLIDQQIAILIRFLYPIRHPKRIPAHVKHHLLRRLSVLFAQHGKVIQHAPNQLRIVIAGELHVEQEPVHQTANKIRARVSSLRQLHVQPFGGSRTGQLLRQTRSDSLEYLFQSNVEVLHTRQP